MRTNRTGRAPAARFAARCALAGFLLGLCSAAGAAAITSVHTGIEGGSGDVDNVLFNPCGPGANQGPSTTITGCLNVNHNYLVDFTADQSIFYAGGGQATIAADDDPFTRLEISTREGDEITKLILNINATADGTVRFFDQTDTFFDTVFDVSGTGQNFFTIFGDGLTTIGFQLSNGNVGAVDVRQVRLATDVVPVPEPGTLGLIALSLLALGGSRRFTRTAS